jgi:2-keto-4-pentenoate hydratase/2-oxohepta-3-ene-1,7-dioic acid hydratase in catechol pathway
MKYCRFRLDQQSHYGAVEDRNSEHWIINPIAAPEADPASQPAQTPPASAFVPTPVRSAELLPPVVPSKIIGVGRNYREHASELGNEVPAEPLIFFKPPSSILPPGGVILLPSFSQRVDFEGELALVIGRRTRHFNPGSDWRQVLRGFTIANDVTARDLQKKDAQWTRAKGCDTFCPIGPIVSDELDLDAGITVETRVNGELRQHASTRDLIFSVPVLLGYITAAITLEPGDIILTGTPSGVGPLADGDHVEISIPGLGVLFNLVQRTP